MGETTWTATYDEPAEPVTATGPTPAEAVRRLQDLLDDGTDHPPLDLWAAGDRLYVADGPALVGRVFPTDG